MKFKGKATVMAASAATVVVACVFQLYLQDQKYHELLDEFSELEKSNKTLYKEVDSLIENNSQLKSKREELMEQLEEKASELDRKQEVIKENTKVIEELEKDKDKLKKDLQAKKDAEAKKLAQKESTKPRESTGGNWEEFTATYYDANEPSTGKQPGDPGYGVTASGKTVEAGVTIAVDPNVIPLGSWVMIEFPDGRTEKRRADDTGSAINGNKIDIYIPKATLSSGRHKVKVKIL